MSIHERDQSSNVLHQVSIVGFSGGGILKLKDCRQVQDLEKQLAYTRQELQRFQSTSKSGGQLDYHYPGSKSAHGSYETSASKKRKISTGHDFSHVRAKFRKFSAGIFKPPYGTSQDPTSSHNLFSSPLLPPPQDVDNLLEQYRTFFHKVLPCIHWPEFAGKVKTVNIRRSLNSESKVWVALLFSVLALGALQVRDQNAQRYFHIAQATFDIWTDIITLDHPRVALLLAVFSIEANQRDVGWNSLGMAIRMAQDIGLHTEAEGDANHSEREPRRRLWYCIYACDT